LEGEKGEKGEVLSAGIVIPTIYETSFRGISIEAIMFYKLKLNYIYFATKEKTQLRLNVE
jgi:hypothetical protein